MSDIIKTIRAEIVRRMDAYDVSIEKYATKQKSLKSERDAWKWAECKSILAFLDSLQEQPVEGLEEAAENYAHSLGYDEEKEKVEIASAKEDFIAGAKWDAERRMTVEDIKTIIHLYGIVCEERKFGTLGEIYEEVLRGFHKAKEK